ncbi:MAG: ABC transporter substrate-binding protein [Beijerinckiaceae bacterium]|nr:ABC transporter substrate-binding protein [Beijerinckiaceae bacterium]
MVFDACEFDGTSEAEVGDQGFDHCQCARHVMVGPDEETVMTNTINRREIMAGAATAGLLGALASGQGAFAQAGPRKTIAVRIDRDLTNLDPAHRTGAWDGNVCRSVFQRLMKQKPNSAELELDAAAEVKQVSPTVVEFRLKPGQIFSDGYGEMTAEDVKFSFERIGLPPVGDAKPSTYKGDWVNLDKVEVTGPLTGRIILTKPRANLFDIAIGDVSGCIVSKKAVEKLGGEHSVKPVGSGPYIVTNLERQRGALLKRHEGYAGPKPAYEEIAIRYIGDPRTTDLALRSGEIDFAVLSPQAADPLRSVAGLVVTEQPSIAYVWLGMNTEKEGLKDIRVRQAIRLALDVDQMLAAGYNGKAPRLNTLLPPQILGHWKDAPVYKRNVAEAKKLLADAGASNLKLKLLILNQPAYQNMALVARALLAEVGITLEVDAQEGGTYWSSGKGDTGKNLDLFILRFNGKHDPNFIMQWFVSGQVGDWNWERWANPDYDALFTKAAGEIDKDKRIEDVIAAQKLMDKSAAFVWLTNEVNVLVHRPWIKPAAVPGWLDWQYDSFAVGA